MNTKNEDNKKKGRRKATTERSLQNPKAMVDTNDLNRRREGRELLLLSVTDVFPSAIATTAVFCDHFEVNMLKSICGVGSILAWVTLIGMKWVGKYYSKYGICWTCGRSYWNSS